ncbi:MAG: hypothetical protein ACREVJ_14230 [Gammaproteobacteria bacterium]
MGSHQTPVENGHAQALRFGEAGGHPRPEHQGPVGNVGARHQRFTGNSSRRLSPGLGGGILQAPWPNHALQPTP